jgi:hypothetical protein
MPILLIGCVAEQGERDANADGDTLRWTPRRFERAEQYKLAWPEIGDTTVVARTVLDSMRKHLFDGNRDVNAFVAAKDAEYQQTLSDVPQTHGWWFDRKAMIVSNRGSFVSVTVGTQDHTGGAHPYGGVWAGTFRLRDGSMMSIDDVLQGPWRTRLDSLGEVAFRAARDVPDTTSLVSAGFFTDPFVSSGRFRLAETWYPSVDGLEFYYNTYEVAPYAAGPTAITIPWTVVADLLRPEMATWVERNGRR